MGYPLGKSQHLLAFLSEFDGRIYVHNETELINQIIRNSGVKLAPFSIFNKHRKEEELNGALIIAPPSIRKSPWLYNLKTIPLPWFQDGFQPIRDVSKPCSEIAVLPCPIMLIFRG